MSISSGRKSILNSIVLRAVKLSIVLCAGLSAAPPVVTKVEPPNWWAGHSINPVRLLIRGENLTGARVESRFAASRIVYSPAGNYLFVDVEIPRATSPGKFPLRITTSEGVAVAPFEVTRTLDSAGRYQGFGPDDVMYLIMPDRFANGDKKNDHPPKSFDTTDRMNPRFYHGGDLQGIVNKLPYLRELGVTAIWLNPIYDNNDKPISGRQPFTDYHGYGAVDFYTVDEHFGDVSTLRSLVDQAHAQGIKIVQDQVANHCGPFHPWAADPPTATWFHGSPSGHLTNPFHTWTLMDPYASESTRKATLEGWFANLLPDLNQNDAEVRRYLIQNTLWWIGMTGLDGIRQDTLPYVDRSFWADWMSAIKREYPRLRVVGEVLERDPALVAFYQGGHAPLGTDTRVDTVFDYPLYYAIRKAFAQSGPLHELAVALARDRLYPNPAVLVTHLGLHDVPRFMSEKGASVESLKLAFTFLMTTRGMPLIYYGDEIGMSGGSDPDNRRDFPGGWPGDARDAFTTSGRTPQEQEVWQHIRKLTRLRAELAPLRHGKLVNLLTEQQQYVYRRENVIIALNNDMSPAFLSFEAGMSCNAEDRLGSETRFELRNGRGSVRLRARSAAIFVCGTVQ